MDKRQQDIKQSFFNLSNEEVDDINKNKLIALNGIDVKNTPKPISTTKNDCLISMFGEMFSSQKY